MPAKQPVPDPEDDEPYAPLLSPDDPDDPKSASVDIEPDDSKKVKLRREIDLMGAILVIVGSQIGSGIFISPKGYNQDPDAGQ